MKRLFCLLTVVMLLGGCGTQSAFETVCDSLDVPAMAVKREIQLKLPKEATAPAMQLEDGSLLYMCDGYTLTVQTLSGGDLGGTIKKVTGFEKDALTVMEIGQKGIGRYEFVWSSAAEEGQQVARAVLLDDGYYHYVVTVMSDSATAGNYGETWQSLLSGVTLSDID